MKDDSAHLFGSPLMPERMWGRIDPSGETGCWSWTGARMHGYGRQRFEGRIWQAHRLAYTLLVGPVPDGLVLDHLCRSTSCVNPAHLEPVTQRTNVMRGDGPSARALAATHCPSGHIYDEANTLIRKSGTRRCRTCDINHKRAFRQRAKARALAARQ